MTVTLFGVDQVWYVTHTDTPNPTIDDWSVWHTVSIVNDDGTVTTVCSLTFQYPNMQTMFNGVDGVADAPQCQECTA